MTVPTPINADKTPDLEPIIASSKLIGGLMKKGSIVESGPTDQIFDTPQDEYTINLINAAYN